MSSDVEEGMERTLQVLTDIQDVADLLAGASVDEIRLDGSGGRMDIVVELTRALLGQRTMVRHGLFHRLRTPWTKCELRIAGVVSAAVSRVADTPIDHAPVVRCEPVGQGYRLTIQSPDGLQMVATADQLQGVFADVGRVIETP